MIKIKNWISFYNESQKNKKLADQNMRIMRMKLLFDNNKNEIGILQKI
jgi:hypothetical protein